MIREWLDVPYQLQRVKWFIQRGRRGWADCDTWSLDDYLEGWLPAAIRHLAEHQHGVPAELCNDCSDVDTAAVKWAAILEDIALGLEAKSHLNCGCGCPDYLSDAHRLRYYQAEKRGMALLVQWWGSLWD